MREVITAIDEMVTDDLDNFLELVRWLKSVGPECGICVHRKGHFLFTSEEFQALTGMNAARMTRWFFQNMHQPDGQMIVRKVLSKSEIPYTFSFSYWGDESIRVFVRARQFGQLRVVTLVPEFSDYRREMVVRGKLVLVE